MNIEKSIIIIEFQHFLPQLDIFKAFPLIYLYPAPKMGTFFSAFIYNALFGQDSNLSPSQHIDRMYFVLWHLLR